MYKQNLISQTSNICKLYSIFSIQSGSKILFNANESGCKLQFQSYNFRSYAVEEKLNTQSLPYKSKSLESICDLICQKYARGKHRMTIKHVEQNVLFPKSAKSYDPRLKNMLVHRASLADLIIICTSYKFLRLNVTKKRTKIFLS